MGDSAVMEMARVLMKANHDLNVVEHSLDKEFKQIYPDNVNPMKLVSRIKRIQQDLLLLKERSCNLFEEKQDLIDKAKSCLVMNRILLQRAQVSCSFNVGDDSDDASYTSFKQVIDEWTDQMRSNTGDRKDLSGSENINQLLFSAIVQKAAEHE